MKRTLDLVVSVAGMVMLAPILILVALVIRIQLGLPVLFQQERLGLNGEPFLIYKFRTMTDARDQTGQLLSDAERLGKVGAILRSLSLDELPTLINVLRGEMSLVGPRPLLGKYRSLYSREQFRRHETKPGITGWAQVNGRNNLSWDEKFKLDVWYVDNRTLWLDLKILLLTVLRVLQRKDINNDDHATMEEFTGSN